MYAVRCLNVLLAIVSFSKSSVVSYSKLVGYLDRGLVE